MHSNMYTRIVPGVTWWCRVLPPKDV